MTFQVLIPPIHRTNRLNLPVVATLASFPFNLTAHFVVVLAHVVHRRPSVLRCLQLTVQYVVLSFYFLSTGMYKYKYRIEFLA
jgi:hypothetical protein